MTVNGLPVAEHDPAWARRAGVWLDDLGAVLAGVATAMEHVGPTAIRGIPAPPVLDLAVRLTMTANVSTVITRLSAAGWTFGGDHADRAGLVFTRLDTEGMAVRLHVIGADQPLWERMVGVRDTLRSDHELAARYADLQRDPTTTGVLEVFLAGIADRFGPATNTPIVRRVRAVLITPNRKILTVRRTKPGEEVHWVLAGGGIETSDSSMEDAAVREVREETGGTPDLHRLVHIAVVAGHAHAIFLARIHAWDEQARSGPEFTQLDPARGGYHLEELDPTDPAFADGRVWPTPTAAFLADHIMTGTDLFTLPDLREQRPPIVWEAR